MTIKLNARKAYVSKTDPGSRRALVRFWNDSFPDIAGVLAYLERLGGTAKLRPDSRLSISRAWSDPRARLNGILQLSRGLARIMG